MPHTGMGHFSHDLFQDSIDAKGEIIVVSSNYIFILLNVHEDFFL